MRRQLAVEFREDESGTYFQVIKQTTRREHFSLDGNYFKLVNGTPNAVVLHSVGCPAVSFPNVFVMAASLREDFERVSVEEITDAQQDQALDIVEAYNILYAENDTPENICINRATRIVAVDTVYPYGFVSNTGAVLHLAPVEGMADVTICATVINQYITVTNCIIEGGRYSNVTFRNCVFKPDPWYSLRDCVFSNCNVTNITDNFVAWTDYDYAVCHGYAGNVSSMLALDAAYRKGG